MRSGPAMSLPLFTLFTLSPLSPRCWFGQKYIAAANRDGLPARVQRPHGSLGKALLSPFSLSRLGQRAVDGGNLAAIRSLLKEDADFAACIRQRPDDHEVLLLGHGAQIG